MSRRWSRRPRRRSLSHRLADYGLTIVLFGLLLVLAARLDRVETRKTEGMAVINDGDSITLGTERIRLRGIDAPEYTQICRKGGVDYACGKLSRQALARLIGGRPVSCTGWQRDRYGRTLGSCRVDGKDINRSQVEAGWAVAYGDFEAEEAAARARKAGIWAGTFDRPRDWRRRHEKGPQAKHSQPERRHDALAAVGDWLREIFRFW